MRVAPGIAKVFLCPAFVVLLLCSVVVEFVVVEGLLSLVECANGFSMFKRGRWMLITGALVAEAAALSG